MPFYPESILDEVRNAINIVSLVSEYVALKKRGRNYVARCPFHTEKTPSFNVSEEKQIFMCFGCGLGGDIFKFVMQVEHITFPEAVQFLAERCHVVLPKYTAPEAAGGGTGTDTLRKTMAEAAGFYHRLLLDSREGHSAATYLQDRGISTETIARFQLGYSPAGSDTLIQWMKNKEFTIQAMEECGLAKRSEDGKRIYDTFRGRIMFPITDIRGRTIAFGGRAMGDHLPKYLNSPETRLYNKSRNLYGLSFSREAIKKSDCAVLVEGYMDFIIPFQNGVENLVASLGTSLTPQQVELLGRYTRDVIVSYDPDSAGVAATKKSLDIFLEGDFKVKVLQLPAGQDPDLFIRREGPEEYRKRIRESTSYLDFLLDAAIRSQNTLEDPKNKVHVINAVLPYLAKLPNAVERSDYVFRFARKMGIEDQQLLAEVKRAAQQKRTQLAEAPLASLGAMKFAEKRLLQLLLSNTDLQPQILPLCSKQDFAGLATERLFTALLDGISNNQLLTFEMLHLQFAGEAEQTILAQLQMEDIPEHPSSDTAESLLNALRKMRLASYKQKILAKIAEAAQQKDDEMLNQLIEQRILVDRELVSLSRK